MRRGGRALTAIVVVGLVSLPLTARAQHPAKLPRVGVLSPFDGAPDPFVDVLRRGFCELDYVGGPSVVVKERAAPVRG